MSTVLIDGYLSIQRQLAATSMGRIMSIGIVFLVVFAGLISSILQVAAQAKESITSLAAKGFEAKGISNGGSYFIVVMQKGAEVYLCQTGIGGISGCFKED